MPTEQRKEGTQMICSVEGCGHSKADHVPSCQGAGSDPCKAGDHHFEVGAIEIRTIALASRQGMDQQTDYRVDCPESIIVALGDGRLITIDGMHIVVHGPDMETLLDRPLPEAYPTPAVRALIAEAAVAVETIDADELESETELRFAHGDR